MEYLIETANINQTEVNNVSILENMDQVLTLANSLLALVVIIIGMSWIMPLKEKQNAASFTFWSQLLVRLIRIKSHLMSDSKCLYYLYSPEARSSWSGVLAPNPSEFSSLKEMVAETLSFLQGADDQMPPYSGWTDDYKKLLDFFTDIIIYDICNSGTKFKYTTSVEYGSLINLVNSICDLIELICNNIVDKQKYIERKLTIPWYKRIVRK